MVSWITVLTPADEHYNTSPHDVKTSSLFFHQPSTLASKSTPFLSWIILHERCSWRTAPWWCWRPFFLCQLPLLIQVERWGSSSTLISAAATCGWSHNGEQVRAIWYVFWKGESSEFNESDWITEGRRDEGRGSVFIRGCLDWKKSSRWVCVCGSGYHRAFLCLERPTNFSPSSIY